MIIRHGFWWDRFWGMIPKVLPTVYDDSLSYYEVLNKLIKATAELAGAIDGIDPDTVRQDAELAAESAEEAQTYAAEASQSARTQIYGFSEPHLITPSIDPDNATPSAFGTMSTIYQTGYLVCVNMTCEVTASELTGDDFLFGKLPKPMGASANLGYGLYNGTVDSGAGRITAQIKGVTDQETGVTRYGLYLDDGTLNQYDLFTFNFCYIAETPYTT